MREAAAPILKDFIGGIAALAASASYCIHDDQGEATATVSSMIFSCPPSFVRMDE